MKEIEVKILEVNREEVVKKLLKLGAEKIFEGDVYSKVYNFEDKRLKKNDSFIRLRNAGDRAFLTFKSKELDNEEAKVREEVEVEVDNFEKTESILNLLGLKCRQEYAKRRVAYRIDNVFFEFDHLTGEFSHIPEFLEIEGPDIKTIHKYVEKLGFRKEDCKSWGGKKFVEHYQDKK